MAQTVFGQAGGGTIASDTASYAMGMQFTLSLGAPLTGIWFYSAAGAVQLPAGCAIYQMTGAGTGAQVTGTGNSSPSWSGAAGSGWVKCAYGGSVTLTSGTTYKVVVTNGGGGNFWYSATANYWTTGGAGSGGITSGIITAPDTSGGDGGQDTFVTSTVLAYPTTSFNATNYWVDVEVSPAVTVTSGPPLFPSMVPRPAVAARFAGRMGAAHSR